MNTFLWTRFYFVFINFIGMNLDFLENKNECDVKQKVKSRLDLDFIS